MSDDCVVAGKMGNWGMPTTTPTTLLLAFPPPGSGIPVQSEEEVNWRTRKYVLVAPHFGFVPFVRSEIGAYAPLKAPWRDRVFPRYYQIYGMNDI